MLLWFAGMSFLAVWVVFHDPAIDHRLVMAGAVLPDVVDGVTGGPWVLHSVLGSVALLTAVMLGTVHRRLLRRQLIALPIGIYSAMRQYSFADYVFTTLGFIGLAIPNFLLALILMYLGFRYLGPRSRVARASSPRTTSSFVTCGSDRVTIRIRPSTRSTSTADAT